MTESARACALPRVTYTGEGAQAYLAKPGCTITLNGVQCRALEAIATEGGAVLPIAVGYGKTFIALLAGAVLRVQYAVILCPAGVVNQMHREYARLSEHFRTSAVRILSYAQLSRPEGTSILESMAAAANNGARLALVADEAHKLKHFTAARTKRVARLFEAAPSVHFVALSGTMTSKSLQDFGHLAAWALRDRAPMPRAGLHLESWAACIDANGKPAPEDWARLRPLVDTSGLSGKARKALARRAFQERLRTGPGIVATRENELGVSLRIHTIDDVKVPAEVAAFLQQASEGESPDGEILVEDIAVWRLERQLSCGFYYRWVWPDGVVDRDWLYARRDWSALLRQELQSRAAAGYDSPMLVAATLDRQLAGGVRPRALHKAWLRWKEQKAKPPPPTETVWVSDYFLDDIRQRNHGARTIYWYESRAMADALEAAGLMVYRAGEAAPLKNPKRPIALSISSHGTGTDGLQHWSDRCVVLEPPSSGKAWEQLLGRTHRVGQQSDTVHIHVYTHTERFRQSLRTARDDATYIQDTTGNVQKLRIADFITT